MNRLKYRLVELRRTLSFLLVVTMLALLSSAGASTLEDPLTIFFESSDGERIPIGELQLTPGKDGFNISVDMNGEKLEENFLSMRPFKCLPHPDRTLCHLVYPYQNNRFITEDDLTDLEYDLLFLHKSASEYGIDAWNGMYYELTATEKGFIGELRETDLNVLIAPPPEGVLRPIERTELHEPSDTHWARRIIIE